MIELIMTMARSNPNVNSTHKIQYNTIMYTSTAMTEDSLEVAFLIINILVMVIGVMT